MIEALRDEVADSSKHSSGVSELAMSGGGQVRHVLDAYLQADDAASGREVAFVECGGRLPPEASADEIEEGLRTIATERARLADWAMWTNTRNRAMSNGLGPLVEALAADRIEGSAEEAFERAYAAWWLPWAMDDSAELRRFRHWDHEDAIRKFRVLDDKNSLAHAWRGHEADSAWPSGERRCAKEVGTRRIASSAQSETALHAD